MGSGISKNSSEQKAIMSDLRTVLLEKTTEIQQLKAECER